MSNLFPIDRWDFFPINQLISFVFKSMFSFPGDETRTYAHGSSSDLKPFQNVFTFLECLMQILSQHHHGRAGGNPVNA